MQAEQYLRQVVLQADASDAITSKKIEEDLQGTTEKRFRFRIILSLNVEASQLKSDERVLASILDPPVGEIASGMIC
eukprot:m.156413 g.156413  ORF g.156413 m.156413 type:complete len:77 (-) comp52929_c0_seq26:1873-2103(-)